MRKFGFQLKITEHTLDPTDPGIPGSPYKCTIKEVNFLIIIAVACLASYKHKELATLGGSI